MGKHRINIERIEEKNRRHIAFSKRRKGLFKKAADLGALGCHVAAVVISASDNTFTFAHPELDPVLDHFLDEQQGRDRHLQVIPYEQPAPDQGGGAAVEEAAAGEQLEDGHQTASADDQLEDDHQTASAEEDWSEEEEEEEEEGEEEFKMEEDLGDAGDDMAADMEVDYFDRCLKQSVEGMRLEELQEMERSLMELREMAMERWKEFVLKEPLSLRPPWDPRTSKREDGSTSSTAAAAIKTSTATTETEDIDLELRL